MYYLGSSLQLAKYLQPLLFFRYAQWRAYLVRKSKRWRGFRNDSEQEELIEFQPGHTFR